MAHASDSEQLSYPSAAELCAACQLSLKDARVLPCLHSFCRKCVDNMASSRGLETEVLCPLCRTVNRLPEKGAYGLPRDYTQPLGRLFVCRQCEAECRSRNVALWCAFCEEAFCREHALRHVLTSGGHSMVAISSIASTGNIGGSSLLPKLCSSHGQPLRVFCKSCNVAICETCACPGSGSHDQHMSLAYIDAVINERKEVIGCKVDGIRTAAELLELSFKEEAILATEIYKRADEVRAEIRAAGERAIQIVESSVRKLLRTVDAAQASYSLELARQRAARMQSLGVLKGTVDFSDRLVANEHRLVSHDLPILLSFLEKKADFLASRQSSDLSNRAVEIGFSFETPKEENLALKVEECIGVLRCSRKGELSHSPGKERNPSVAIDDASLMGSE